MADRDTDLVEKLIGQRLADIAQELKNLNQLLEGYKAATEKEMQTIETQRNNLQSLMRAIPVGIPRYLSGRWPLRDGDTYGIVAPQPPLIGPGDGREPSDNADNPPGHIRSTDER